MDGLSHDPAQVAGYRMRARLGDGGLGRVYLARSPAGTAVAFTLIRPELAEDARFLADFGREVAAARRLGEARGVAPVLDADPDGPQPWIASAYVPGMSLHDAVFRHGPLSLAATLTLARGLAETLIDLHAGGLTHGDLKPSNVMLAADGPRVIDFGIAGAAEASRRAQAGTPVGPAGFVAPEQAAGEEVGPPADVFALGATLVYALTGVGPFGDGPRAQLLDRVTHAEPDLTGIPKTLRPTIERCLSRDPAARPTAAALEAEFTEATAKVEPPIRDSWLPSDLRRAILKRTRRADALLHEPEPAAAPGKVAREVARTAQTPAAAPSPISVSPFESAAEEQPGSSRRRVLVLALTPVTILVAAVSVVLSTSGGGQTPTNDAGTAVAALDGGTHPASRHPAGPHGTTPAARADDATRYPATSAVPAASASAVIDGAAAVVVPSVSAGMECSLEGPSITSCSSVNPNLTIYQLNVADTSHCTFTFHLDWGDGTSSNPTVRGGSAPSLFVGEHSYHAPGSYSPMLTATKVSGSCAVVDVSFSYTYQ